MNLFSKHLISRNKNKVRAAFASKEVPDLTSLSVNFFKGNRNDYSFYLTELLLGLGEIIHVRASSSMSAIEQTLQNVYYS